MWPENWAAWQLFCDCASRHRPDPKADREVVEVDWPLADILTRRRGLSTEDFEKVLRLAKALNRRDKETRQWTS